ncbi:MAG: hypothetical protein H6728_01525 [Myxococcales bacterium]|nr:hypothetical protein [Myxococcales bacterium]
MVSPKATSLPALDAFSASSQGNNAFTETLNYAKSKMYIAQSKEEIALQTKRNFDTSAASFQSELGPDRTKLRESTL